MFNFALSSRTVLMVLKSRNTLKFLSKNRIWGVELSNREKIFKLERKIRIWNCVCVCVLNSDWTEVTCFHSALRFFRYSKSARNFELRCHIFKEEWTTKYYSKREKYNAYKIRRKYRVRTSIIFRILFFRIFKHFLATRNRLNDIPCCESPIFTALSLIITVVSTNYIFV
jgi:hypothetical protein